MYLLQTDRETGYEASEEGSIDENISINVKRYQPLLFLSIYEPNAYLSRQQLSRTIQLSFFKVDIRISDMKRSGLKTVPCEADFTINLLETKSGEPNPDTGILPALFTAKWVRGLGKPSLLDVNIAKPVKVFFSMARWNQLMQIKDRVLENLKSPLDDTVSLFDRVLLVTNMSRKFEAPPQQKIARTAKEQFSTFTTVSNRLGGVSSLNVKLAQVVFVFNLNRGSEVNLSIGKFKSHLSLCNRPERLTNVAVLESLTLGVKIDGFRKLVLNPWTVSIEVCLFWETWQPMESNPQVQIMVESDCFIVDISPEQTKCVEMLLQELQEFIITNTEDSDGIRSPTENNLFASFPPSERDQHYKDDLRAGAFQFVDTTTNNSDELPLPYQVMFWNQHISAMAWRYPQPRALTKVRIFPVPLQLASEEQTDRQLYGNLEYWSDCQGCYLPYSQFALSESEVTHLRLPESHPLPVVASTWRVVLCTPNHSSQNIDYDYSGVMISSRVLAACMRIDSYFNMSLVPIMNIAIQIAKINISLYNSFNKSVPAEMPNSLKPFVCDMAFPDTHCFLTLNINNIKSYITLWNLHTAAVDISSTIQCSVLDYTYLTQQDFVESFTSKFHISVSDMVNVNFCSKPLHFKFGPCIAHTFVVSAQNWHQSFNKVDPSLVVMTHYVICNDTNLILCFGQAGTDEDILLLSRHCHLYSWRSQKSKHMIKVGLEQNGRIWSKPFLIDIEGTEHCVVSPENNVALIVTVKKLSATQKQVIFSGQLIISNMLLEHFEMKVVKASRDKEKDFKQALKFIVGGQSTPPSILLDTTEKYYLRLRFFSLECAWSGDIPLLENTKCAQPWLVKGNLSMFAFSAILLVQSVKLFTFSDLVVTLLSLVCIL